MKIDDIYGMWKLLKFTQTEVGTGTITYPFGSNPKGYISFDRSGRVLVMITDEIRSSPESDKDIRNVEKLSLYLTMMSYGGTFSFDPEGNGQFTIDIAWNKIWEGQHQSRRVKFSNDELVIEVGPQLGISNKMITAELRWTRA